MSIEQVMQQTRRRRRGGNRPIKPDEWLSTGSTLLNLALSGTPHGGFCKGRYFFVVGDSASGKTFLTLTCLAEATQNKNFADYRLIYDNAEDGALMDVRHFFGKSVARRLEPPAGTRRNPEYSEFVEEFYFNLDDALSGGPCIYLLDSMDALGSLEAEERFDDAKKSHRAGKEIKGSYGDVHKAKVNSSNIRRILPALRKTRSILIVLSQTRDDINPRSMKTRTRSGGRSLRFYSHAEIWSKIIGRREKTVKAKKRQIGSNVELDVQKNRLNGKLRKVVVPIMYDYGFDDVGACIDYLVAEGHWKKNGSTINATEFEIKATREKLIAEIEEMDGERDLAEITGDCWNSIERGMATRRKRRYV